MAVQEVICNIGKMEKERNGVDEHRRCDPRGKRRRVEHVRGDDSPIGMRHDDDAGEIEGIEDMGYTVQSSGSREWRLGDMHADG